jgi:transaldolase
MAATRNPQLLALNELRQSVWYDNLSRDVLNSGELENLIAQGVSGLTSNPTIFKQAIADTSNYDSDMRSADLKALSTEDLCEELMIRDVAAAADLLRPVYDATGGSDGYASIEVSPFLADDCAGTIAAAERIWAKLARPNVMIKIPATPACIPAIEAVLDKGINVNVTLIFSRSVYEEVANAYVSALESRASRGESVRQLSSVASFFVSRVDAIVEKSIDALVVSNSAPAGTKEKYLGKVGIANSKVAYSAFEEIFSRERFKAVRELGARVQRPLWASTGTKNPAFKATMYVEELAGSDTVNTMPPATLKALLVDATIEPRLHSGFAEAKELIVGLAPLGVDFEKLLIELQLAGVKSFADSYRDLLQSIETKRRSV